MKTIEIYGKQYPMRMTMGAMLRFKRATGVDVSQMGSDVSLMITLLHCCVQSACNADGVEFGLDLDTFADGLTPEVLNSFAESLTAEAADGAKKKRLPSR